MTGTCRPRMGSNSGAWKMWEPFNPAGVEDVFGPTIPGFARASQPGAIHVQALRACGLAGADDPVLTDH